MYVPHVLHRPEVVQLVSGLPLFLSYVLACSVRHIFLLHSVVFLFWPKKNKKMLYLCNLLSEDGRGLCWATFHFYLVALLGRCDLLSQRQAALRCVITYHTKICRITRSGLHGQSMAYDATSWFEQYL